ncbi:hypothetical protein KP79_PYT02115 [Mizuhopecten yessoensis]|uniref:Peptidase S1 domain-containing protein n=1 Tax=Mizuhopecten yessoensis TaxID=6573 RepID=A0A210PZA6_MIZYE|nr:hypothetical protein KP79_PYT02115 [Mizuhopecten yessoensis]
MGDITPANREDNVKSMHDLCKCLKSNGTIVYGGYKTLRAVLRAQNVEAGQIIDTYTKLIHQENEGNGVENTCKSQAVFSEQNSEDRKRKQGPSGDRDPLDDSKLRKEKRKKVEEDRPYQFRKQMDNTHDARIIDVWTRARNAVGRIRGPQYTGTGIRVGTKYILTAYHVAKDITKNVNISYPLPDEIDDGEKDFSSLQRCRCLAIRFLPAVSDLEMLSQRSLEMPSGFKVKVHFDFCDNLKGMVDAAILFIQHQARPMLF